MTSDVAICRTCLAECTQYSSLHKQGIIMGEVTSLANLINFSISVDVTEERHLPAQMCERCVNLLAKSYLFKKMILEANEYLKKQQTESVLREDDNESHVVVQTEQHYVQADDLEGLADAAQMKRNMDGMDYVMHVYNDEDGELDVDNAVVENEETIDITSATDDIEEEILTNDEQNVEVISTGECEIEGEVDAEYKDEVDPEYKDEVDIEFKDDVDGECEETIYIERPIKSDSTSVEGDGDGDDDWQSETYEVTLQEVEIDENGEIEDEHKIKKDEESTNFRYTRYPQRNKKILRGRNKSTVKCNNPLWRCKVCGKQLSNGNSFKYHMQLHSDNTPFLCSLCGEGFKTRNAYEGHIIIHDPNNPNTCELCGKSYRQASSLKTHMLAHTGEKPFQCDICGKGLTQKSGYKKHMLTHTGEKPHVCDICNREFRYSSNLIAHKRGHTGEKPYECAKCNKTFPSAEQLKRHMLVHTEERPYVCELCDKKFKRRSSLIVHRQTHETIPGLVDQKVAKSNVVELY